MATEERATGTPNHIYDAVAALHNLLEAGTVYEQYISDAQAADDTELADLFERLQSEDQQRVEELKGLLGSRL